MIPKSAMDTKFRDLSDYYACPSGGQPGGMRPYDIKKIEDLSLNAWPSWQMQVYDGWILRFSHFYTHRTNSVDQIGPSAIPLPEKIAFCEEVYRDWGTPCAFKISPVGDPALDGMLEERGYGIEHATTVMVRRLDRGTDSGAGTDHESDCSSRKEDSGPDFTFRVTGIVDPVWLNALFDLKGEVNPVHRRIVPNMYAAIPKKQIPVLVQDGGRTVGTGLGILDRDAVGVYAIHVAEDYRRRGVGSRIVRTILREAAERGAVSAYLQVVSDNAPAKALYRNLGFSDFYRYYFRVLR